MKNYKFKINGNQYEVEVLDIDDNVARIEVNGTLYEVGDAARDTKGKGRRSPSAEQGPERGKTAGRQECREGAGGEIPAAGGDHAGAGQNR